MKNFLFFKLFFILRNKKLEAGKVELKVKMPDSMLDDLKAPEYTGWKKRNT